MNVNVMFDTVCVIEYLHSIILEDAQQHINFVVEGRQTIYISKY